MDGVLLIPTQSSEKSWQQVCQHFAPTLHIAPETLAQSLCQSLDQYKKDIENDAIKQRRDRLEPFETRSETVAKALTSIGRDTAVATEMVHAYDDLREQQLQPTPYAFDVLKACRQQNIPLALISNGNATYQRKKIKHHHLASFFTALLIEEEFGVAKPDPRIFHSALEQIHVSAQEAWMIGDDLKFDIAGAQGVGMFAIWFDPSHKGLPKDTVERPDRIIHTLPELLDEHE